MKILSTLGPASLKKEIIQKLDVLGVDIFRINLSHVGLDVLEQIICTIKEATSKQICIDTEGAQIRNRYMEKNVQVKENALIELTSQEVLGNERLLSLSPTFAVDLIEEGSFVSIDFDSVFLHVIEKKPGKLIAKVLSGGTIGSNKAVTVDHPVALPVLSEKDEKAIELAKKYGIDCYALSFASSAKAVKYVRERIGSSAFLISKIESRQGVRNVDEILEVTDAILIDRGDLSREVAIEKIPFLQKLLIQKANEKKVPVFVAINLLESMTDRRKPTRAEMNDVMNTLLDGADGLVLAAETAVGKHPRDCVALVSSCIQHFQECTKIKSCDDLLADHSFFLTAPHGGTLVEALSEKRDREELSAFPTLFVDETTLMDAEQIAIGTFSPLRGFMTREEVQHVLSDYALPTGTPWPLPILFQVSQEQAARCRENKCVALASSQTKQVHALLQVTDVYPYDLKKLAREMYGVDTEEHAGVKRLLKNEGWFVGGEITLVSRLPRPLKRYELTPRQTRIIFEHQGWSRIVGFHTRNVIHRAHEALQLTALEKYGCDALFVHPVVGPKKKDDYTSEVILKSYEHMVEHHYPSQVLLAAFSTFSRYAGPREAVFTALCRKNFGCSHFIMGRDHTGVGEFYAADASQKLFSEMGDLGIQPVFFDRVSYCDKCGRHVETCEHGEAAHLFISGTKAREMLMAGERPPEWFMRSDISDLLMKAMKEGKEVFVS